MLDVVIWPGLSQASAIKSQRAKLVVCVSAAAVYPILRLFGLRELSELIVPVAAVILIGAIVMAVRGMLGARLPLVEVDHPSLFPNMHWFFCDGSNVSSSSMRGADRQKYY
jgi:hypothetical protein